MFLLSREMLQSPVPRLYLTLASSALSAVHRYRETRRSLRGASPQIRLDTVYRFEVQGLQEHREVAREGVSCWIESTRKEGHGLHGATA